MRGFICSCLIGVCIISALPESTIAQQPAPPEQKKNEPPTPYVRDDSKITAGYALALLVVAMIMLLVCMPARRE